LTDADLAMIELAVGVDVSSLKELYYNKVNQVLLESTIEIPQVEYFQKGGKHGVHTEHMGYILTEMQFMQRTYPNMTW
jgi:ring-1,2-phenylacetyl-CoA epoxidase subunit PaaC